MKESELLIKWIEIGHNIHGTGKNAVGQLA